MEKFVHNGLTLEYEISGQGEPFFFLHGMGGSVEQIQSIYQPIPGVRLISLNQQGHGSSEADWSNLTFGSLADDLRALMDYLEIRQATIGGISMGAAVCLNFAVRFPDRVKRLLLVRNAWTDRPMSPEVQTAYRDLGLALKTGDIENFYSSEGWNIVNGPSDYTRNAFTCTFQDPACLRFWQKYLILPPKVPILNLEVLNRLTMPVTVLACRNDLCHPYDYGKRLADHTPHAIFREIPDKDSDGAGQKRAVNEAIQELFSRGETGNSQKSAVVNWGVLGTAGIAMKQVIPGMKRTEDCRLLAIAGRNPEKVEKYRKQFGFERAYSSYDALLEDPEVQAVYIPLPNSLHYAWTMKALKKGKHVLCEKPLAPTAQQAEEMVRTARENGVLLMEAFAYLHSPLIHAVREELRSGAIGEPVYMESAFLTSGYDPKNIRVRRETFGGSMYDLGCYNASLILWMLEDSPEEVQASAEFSEQRIDLQSAAVLRFPDGKRAGFSCGMCLSEETQRIDRWCIFGTKGWIKTEAEFNGCGDLTYTVCTEGEVRTKQLAVPQNYHLEIAQFDRCILHGEQPLVTNEFSLRNAALMDRLLQAIHY